MAASGPQWSLYPLLAIVAFVSLPSFLLFLFLRPQIKSSAALQCEFVFGLTHVALCLPTHFLLLPVLSGVLGLIAAFHAIFLRYPNRSVVEAKGARRQV